MTGFSSHLQTAIALTTLSATPALAAPSVWDIDTQHASAQFKTRHLMVSHVRGELGAIQGTVWLDEQDVSRSRVEVTIDVRAVNTRDAKRDEHLRSADFLDVDKHPSIAFRSTSVRRGKGEALTVLGDLTVRGVTRPVSLEVGSLSGMIKDPWGNTKRGATARATINRRDFGLTWNAVLEAGGVAVGDQVLIEIDLELVRRK